MVQNDKISLGDIAPKGEGGGCTNFTRSMNYLMVYQSSD